MIGWRSRRLAPTMLAVIAAMIRIASRPSRKTIRAALVTTVNPLAPSPVVSFASLERLVEDEPGVPDVAHGPVVGDQLGEALLARGAVPDQSLDLGRQLRIEGPQQALGAELEEGVGAEPGLLGLLALAGADGGLHLIEADRDQVEVGLGVGLLPLLGHHLVEGVAGLARGPPRPRLARRPRGPRWQPP